MTNICILKRNFSSPGGLEKYTLKVSQAFAKRQGKVTILTADPVHQTDPNISFVRLASHRKLGWRKIEEFDHKVTDYLSNHSFGVILGMDRNKHPTHIRAGNGVHAAYLKQRSTIDPFLKRISAPFNPLNRLILHIEKESFESPELKVLFTNSHMVKHEILEYYHTPPEKIEVIHNGVEWKEMERDFNTWIESKSRMAPSFKLDPSVFQFLFIGNGYQRKGLEPLLTSLSLLSSRDFHLSVIGKDKNIPHYQAIAAKLGLSEHVTFFGPRTDTRAFYQFCDCLVIPSYYDPFANVTVEALAMGLFVVSSKHNGGSEVLKSSMGSIIPSLADKESFAHTLKQALSHPKTWIRSQNIRSAVQYLDFPNQLNQLINRCLKP
jgi:UDP-glucose:(heptosyl)LPS alpha-1,3-glucosyltransferase